MPSILCSGAAGGVAQSTALAQFNVAPFGACGSELLSQVSDLEVRAWADEQRRLRPSLRRVGVFGSYGRAPLQWAVIWICSWPLERLPLSCDAVVLTPAELDQLFGSSSRMAQELQTDLLWLN